MKKKFLCLLLGIVLCLSFALPLYAIDGTIIADDNAELVTPTLEITTIPTGAAAIARNLTTNQTYYYRVNGNILPTSTDGSLYESGWMPETASTNEIIGSDDRTKVTNTQVSPYSAIAYLDITFPLGIGNGTATMISPNAALTVAHVLYDSTKGGWATSIKVTPAISGSKFFPNTPYGYSMARELVISIPFFETGDSSKGDWGVIRLSDSIGNISGFLGFQYIARNIANEFSTTISGYPDEPNYTYATINQYEHSGTIYNDESTTTTASNTTVYQNRIFYYRTDATSGQSGSPILYNDNGTYQIIGMHSRGNSSSNKGFGLTYQVFNFLWSYKNNPQ